jgi:hypothetical protein
MKCEFCGEGGADYSLCGDRRIRACPKCDPLCSPILTLQNGRLHSREVMIGQHQNEPRRKLLELKNHVVTVFLSESLDVIALEIESRIDRRVLRWSHPDAIREFSVRNVGKSYSNRDEMTACTGFDLASLKEDVELNRNNLQPRVIRALSACLLKVPTQ